METGEKSVNWLSPGGSQGDILVHGRNAEEIRRIQTGATQLNVLQFPAVRCIVNRRFLGIFSALLLLAVALSGSIHATAPKTEMVSYKSGADTVSGYLALPEGGGRHPAIIVIHEWWGLNDWVKEEAQKLAEQGYVALAVDLYRGHTASDPGEAHELSRGLPQDRGVRDLQAAFDYLASRRDVEKDHIGSIGWCMGGGYSIQLAIAEPRLAACVVNYGALPTDAASIAKIHAPILGNFGAEDRGITPTSVQAFEKAMKDAGKSVDAKIYDGAGHAFENPNNKAGYRPDTAKDSWARIVAFFHKTLH
jgi:carboxymethylenebutenolidase